MRAAPGTLLPTTLALLAAALLGAAVAGTGLTYHFDGRLARAQGEAAKAAARVSILESVLRRHVDNNPALADAGAEPLKVEERSGAPGRAMPDPAPMQVRKPAAQAQAQGQAQGQATVAAPAPAQPASPPGTHALPRPPVASSGAGAADSPADDAITPELVAQARRTNRLEGMDGAKLGVRRVDSAGVELKDGRTIRPGGRFPSGERLLAVDPSSGQIVTDRRTILVF